MSEETKKSEKMTDVPSPELPESELTKAVGGRKGEPDLSEIVVTKPTDIAST